MPYQWPLDPQELFVERYPQMINTGLPAQDADAMRAAITEMWADAPGGWVFEWSRLGARYAEEGNEALATLAYGWAKFPVIADNAKLEALQHQIDHYMLAAKDFPIDLVRRFVEVPYRGSSTRLPVHVLAAPDLPENAPVLIASGGVDSWKMDLHTLFAAFALNTSARVIAFDIPGTGECPIPLSRDSVKMIDGLVAYARELGDGTVAHLGISMGGYFSAATGLAGSVDAAIVLGGPVESAFAPGRSFQFGMADIVGNAFGFDRRPSVEEAAERRAQMSLRPLLDEDRNSPMLVVNGADDIHVPREDTLVFEDRRDTRVELLADTGHCAVSRLGDVVPMMIDWLNVTLYGTRVTGAVPLAP
jgi:esterase FrsA